MSSANTWYDGNKIDVSGYTGYWDSWYLTSIKFSVLENGNSQYKVRLYANVWFNEWTGWSSSSLTIDGTSKVSSSNTIYPNGTTGWATNGPWTKDVTINKTTSTQNKSYSASSFCGGSGWSSTSLTVSVPALASYTISYNANNGSGAPGNQTKYYGINLTLSSTVPTRSGYKFLGWSTNSSATSATYAAGGTYSANSGATLYAVWEAQASPVTSVTDVTLTSAGATTTVKWTPLINTFKYKVKFTVGSYEWETSDYISPASTSEYTYTSPALFDYAMANYITNAASITATCSLTTYNSSGTQMGNVQTKTFTVSVPSEIVPTITSVSFAEGTQAGFNGRLTKGLSTVVTTVGASGTYGSTVQNVYVTILDSTYTATASNAVYVATSNVLMSYGNIEVGITVLDSRNRTATTTRTITVYDYFIPYGSFTIHTSGTTVTVHVIGNVAPVDDQNTKTLTIERTRLSDSLTTTVTFTPSTYSFTQDWVQTLADAETATYSYKVTLVDKKGNKYEETQRSAIVAISRFRGGKGVTFFGSAQENGFWIVSDGHYIKHDISYSDYLEMAILLASDYSTSSSYFVGQFCIYNASVYECNTPISAGETWTAAHWDLIGTIS